MKKLLSLVALVGLIGGAFYVFAPKAEAALAPVVATVGQCGTNPYDDYGTPVMPWPYCGPGMHIDLECVALFQDVFDTLAGGLVDGAKADWDSACTDLQKKLDTAWKTYQACGGADSTNPQCKINYDQSNDTAYSEFGTAVAGIASDLASDIADLQSDMLENLLDCCREGPGIIPPDDTSFAVTPLPLEDPVCPDPPFEFDTNCLTNGHPTPSPINAPSGPIMCPIEYHIDWECVGDAEDAYKDAVRAAYVVANSGYISACQEYHATYSESVDTFVECLGLAPVDCMREHQARVQAAKCAAKTSLDGIQNTLNAALLAATAGYWAAVAECCEPDGGGGSMMFVPTFADA